MQAERKANPRAEAKVEQGRAALLEVLRRRKTLSRRKFVKMLVGAGAENPGSRVEASTTVRYKGTTKRIKASGPEVNSTYMKRVIKDLGIFERD